MAYLSQEELESIGFKSVGSHVFISDKATFYNPTKINIGSYVRIDDYCLISAGDEGIDIGNYVHISCYATLIGRGKITLNDFVAISIKATVISSTSDFSGEYLPSLNEFKNINEYYEGMSDVISQPVVFETHSGMGAHSVVLPGVTVGIGSAIGAMSVVYEDLNPWGIFLGNPARFIRKRSDKLYKKIEDLKREFGVD